jgi:trimeric autotransporter adhesin
MGTTLTGTTIKTTYNGLIKLADNGTMEAAEKTLTDGLGNDSALKLGTAGIQVTGTLKDSSGDVGTSGQFLSSTATGTNWVDVVIPAGVFEAGSGTGSIESVVGGAAASGNYAFAVGLNTYATGANSVSFNGGSASGEYSFAHLGGAGGNGAVAMGQFSTAGTTDTGVTYDDSQIAIGLNSYASGSRAVALGSTSYGNTRASGTDSVAIGYNGTASGNYSTAFAYSTASGASSFAFNAGTASGAYSTASGYYAVASGAYSTSSGRYTNASGDNSFAHGSNTTASGDYSFAFSGGQATGGRSMASMTGVAAGHGSIALGYASRAGNADGGSPYGDGQIAIGTNSYAYGQFGMALGSNSFGNVTASGDYSTAIGGGSTASGEYSLAMNFATASGDSSVAINGGTASGYYSVAISSGISPCTASGEQSFAIGVSCLASADFSGVIGNGVASHQGAICINASSNRETAVFVNQLSIMSIPTSAAGLPSGAVWRNGTVLNIVP